MLVLLVSMGDARLAMDARRVEQVVPRVPLRSIPTAPAHLVGLLDRGGRVLPVVDLSMRLAGRPSADRLSTRIIVARTRHAGREVELGIVAECVTELVECKDAQGDEPAAARGGPGLECLGRVVRIGQELVQWVEIDRFLTADEKAWVYDVILDQGHEPVGA